MNDTNEAPPRFIYETRTFTDAATKQEIQEIIPLDGDIPEGMPRYVVRMKARAPNGVVVAEAVEPIDAHDPHEAFDMLPPILKKMERKLNETVNNAISQAKIQQNMQNAPAILGANGLKLRRN